MKNARDIIELIRNALGSIRAGKNRAIIVALEDGAALAALGITDDDKDAVEEAYALMSAKKAALFHSATSAHARSWRTALILTDSCTSVTSHVKINEKTRVNPNIQRSKTW